MKKTLSVMVGLLFSITAYSQVGINRPDPRAALDVELLSLERQIVKPLCSNFNKWKEQEKCTAIASAYNCV